MEYLFAPSENYEDFASGSVIQSRPGMPAFPIRLASELFLRAVNYLQDAGVAPPYHIYDPVCGGSAALTALGFMHKKFIRSISASDIEDSAVKLAAANLSLLTFSGLQSRKDQIQELSVKYLKQSHVDAFEAAVRLQKNASFQNSDINVFKADALDAHSMQNGLGLNPVDILFADMPYGQLTHWLKENEITSKQLTANDFLSAIAELPILPKVIIFVTTGKERPNHDKFRRLKTLQNGKRRIFIFKAKN